jgi:hypothetical protein
MDPIMPNYECETEVPATKANESGVEPLDFGQELEALGAILKALGPLSEEARKFVLRTASDRLAISSVVHTPKDGSVSVSTSNSTPQSGGLEGTSPKDFLRAKKPLTELQRIVCLAFYLTYALGKRHFKTQDLTALNTDAAGGKFSNPSMTVQNATTQSHFLAPGPKGTKQITALGEEYVDALPDQEAAKTVVLSHRPKSTRKRRPVKKAP